MSPRTGSAFPTTLRTWLQEVVRSIPSRCVGTLLELLFGTMLTDRGMISQAILAIAPRRGWQAYYWFVEHAHFPWIGLVHALCDLVEREFCEHAAYLLMCLGTARMTAAIGSQISGQTFAGVARTIVHGSRSAHDESAIH